MDTVIPNELIIDVNSLLPPPNSLKWPVMLKEDIFSYTHRKGKQVSVGP